MKSPLPLALTVVVMALPLLVQARTLKSYGAVGDGKTDDRDAIIGALTQARGHLVDGEGKTYAVRGNVEVSGVPVNFRNATLVQTIEHLDMSKYIPSAKGKGKPDIQPTDSLVKMVDDCPVLTAFGIANYAEDPVLGGDDLAKVVAYTSIRTLAVRGTKDKKVAVHLENIKIRRGEYPDSGQSGAGAILIEQAGPVDLIDVEVTGDGKGKGVGIEGCSRVNLLRVNIHDLRWAPYSGDVEFPFASVKEVYRWNNFPIYDYRHELKKFVRVRVQEKLAGLFVVNCEDVVIADSRVAHLEMLIEGKPYAVQADGMTIGGVTNLLIKNCQISHVWEGIDLTGSLCKNFVYENVRTEDCFSFGLKLAHPKQDGRLEDCTVTRSGNAGFEIEPGVENVEFLNCRAIDTGSTGYWGEGDGFRIIGAGKPGEAVPNRLSFVNCEAINREFPGAMNYGFRFAPASSAITPDRIRLKDCKVEGAGKADLLNLTAQ